MRKTVRFLGFWDWPIELFSCEQALPFEEDPQRQFKDHQGCRLRVQPGCTGLKGRVIAQCLGLKVDGTHVESCAWCPVSKGYGCPWWPEVTLLPPVNLERIVEPKSF